MGLFGITVPEEYGGLDLDPVSFALVFEELARGWMGIAGILGSHSLACRMIAMHGTEEQKQRYLPELATGVRRTGIGLTEPDAGTDLQGIRTTRRSSTATHYVVNGTKMWITNARYANPLPVLVKTDPSASPAHQGMSVLLVDADTPGYEVTRDIPKARLQGDRVVRGPARPGAGARRVSCSAASRARACSRCSRPSSGAGSTSPPARSGSRSAPTTRR